MFEYFTKIVRVLRKMICLFLEKAALADNGCVGTVEFAYLFPLS